MLGKRNASLRLVLLAQMLLLTATSAAQAEIRTWVYTYPGRAATTKLEAEYAGMEGVDVLLRFRDGKVYKATLAHLRDEDKAHVELNFQAKSSEFHVWQFDKEPIEARYAGVREGMIVLETKGGSGTRVPWTRLSPNDQAYLIAAQKAVHALDVADLRKQMQWQPAAEGVAGLTLNPQYLPRGDRYVVLLAFSPEGRSLLSVQYGADHTVVWDVPTAQRRTVFRFTLRYQEGDSPWCFHPSGKEAWRWTGRLTRWDLFTGIQTEGEEATPTPWCTKIGKVTGNSRFGQMLFSADGRFLAVTPRYDHPARKVTNVFLLDGAAWDLREGLFGGSLGEDNRPTQLQISPDGNAVAVKMYSGEVRVWDMKSRKLHTVPDCKWLLGFIDKGKYVATAKSGGMRVDEVATGAQEAEVAFGDGNYWYVVSPVGRLAALAFNNGTLDLRRWPGGETFVSLSAHDCKIRQMAFSPDGKLLATGDETGTIKMWNLSDLNKVQRRPASTSEGEKPPAPSPIQEPTSPPEKAPAQPADGSIEPGFVSLFDGRSFTGWQGSGRFYRIENEYLVAHFPEEPYSGDEDQNLYTAWEYGDFVLRFEYCIAPQADTGILIRTPVGGNATTAIEVQLADIPPDDSRFAQHNGSLWGVAPSRPGHEHPPGQWNQMELTCQGREVTVRLNGVRILAGNLDRFANPGIAREHPGLANAKGRIALFGGHSRGFAEYRKIRIKQLASADKSELGPLGNETPSADPVGKCDGNGSVCLLLPEKDDVDVLAWSPDGSTLATDGRDGTVVLWDARSGRKRGILEGFGSDLDSLVFSPNGKQLAAADDGDCVTLWDLPAKTGRKITLAPAGGSQTLAFSPDGRLLAVACEESRITVTPVDGAGKAVMLSGHRGDVTSVSFSPDGRLLASGSGDTTIRLWDAKTWQLHTTLEGSTGRVRQVVFSPSGQLIASASEECGLRLWDVASGQPVVSLDTRGDYPSLAFSPDGRYIANGLCFWKVTDIATRPANTTQDAAERLRQRGQLLQPTHFEPAIAVDWDRMESRQSDVEGVYFSPDGRAVATVHVRGFAAICDMACLRLNWAFDYLHYGAGVSEHTALAVGRLFSNAGFLDPSLGTRLVLTRSAAGHTLSVALPRGGANDNQVVQGVLGVAKKAADQLLRSPLAVRFCDQDLNIRRIETIGDPAVARPFAALNTAENDSQQPEVLIRVKKEEDDNSGVFDLAAPQASGPEGADLRSPWAAWTSLMRSMAPPKNATGDNASPPPPAAPAEPPVARPSSGAFSLIYLVLGLAAGAAIAIGGPKVFRLLARQEAVRLSVRQKANRLFARRGGKRPTGNEAPDPQASEQSYSDSPPSTDC